MSSALLIAAIDTGVVTLTGTLALVVVTAWYAWSNHRYVALTREILLAQTSPCVVAYTRRKPGPVVNQIEIVVKNFGSGVAKNVRFQRSSGVSEADWKTFLDQIDSRVPYSAIKTGISVLPPGVEITIFWDPEGFMLKLPDGIRLVCSCERLGPGLDRNVDAVECLLATLHPL